MVPREILRIISFGIMQDEDYELTAQQIVALITGMGV